MEYKLKFLELLKARLIFSSAFFYFNSLVFPIFYSTSCTTLNEAKEAGKAELTQLMVTPEKEIEWKSFFIPPPSTADKSILEEKINQWSHSRDKKTLLSKARAERALGHFVGAEATLINIIRFNENLVDPYIELINLHLSLDKFVEAGEIMNKLEEKVLGKNQAISGVSKESILKLKYLRGLLLISQNSRTEGRRILSEIIGEIPLFTPAYLALTQSYINVKNLKLAEFVILRALDRIKNDPEIFNLAGIVALLQGQRDKAIEMFDNALILNSEFAPSLINRANLNIESGNYVSAEEDLLLVKRIDPTNADGLVAFGNLSVKNGDYQASQRAYIQALELKPNHTYARFNLAVINHKYLGNSSDAKRLLSEILQIPTTPLFLKERAHAYLSQIDGMQGT